MYKNVGCGSDLRCRAKSKSDCWRFRPLPVINGDDTDIAERYGCEYRSRGLCRNCFVIEEMKGARN